MGSITARDLDEGLMCRLRARAAEHRRSVEDEVLEILRQMLGEAAVPPQNLAAAIRARFAPFVGEGLEMPPREPMREPPNFDHVADPDVVAERFRRLFRSSADDSETAREDRRCLRRR